VVCGILEMTYVPLHRPHLAFPAFMQRALGVLACTKAREAQIDPNDIMTT
jgi:hypothetical protein